MGDEPMTTPQLLFSMNPELGEARLDHPAGALKQDKFIFG